MVRHWGVWHDVYGWHWAYGVVFYTEHVAIARAQCDVANRGRPKWADDDPKGEPYRVRCIEDWHATENVKDTLEALDVP